MIRRLLCRLLGHRYVIVRRFSHTARKLRCLRCGEAFAMHDLLRALLPWDGEFDELYCGNDWEETHECALRRSRNES